MRKQSGLIHNYDTYAHTGVRACVSACIRVCMRVYMRVCVCVRVHACVRSCGVHSFVHVCLKAKTTWNNTYLGNSLLVSDSDEGFKEVEDGRRGHHLCIDQVGKETNLRMQRARREGDGESIRKEEE